MNVFVIFFLFVLLQIRVTPGDIIFYIIFKQSLLSPVATLVYAPLQGSTGLLQIVIHQFEVIEPTKNLPLGEGFYPASVDPLQSSPNWV